MMVHCAALLQSKTKSHQNINISWAFNFRWLFLNSFFFFLSFFLFIISISSLFLLEQQKMDFFNLFERLLLVHSSLQFSSVKVHQNKTTGKSHPLLGFLYLRWDLYFSYFFNSILIFCSCFNFLFGSFILFLI